MASPAVSTSRSWRFWFLWTAPLSFLVALVLASITPFTAATTALFGDATLYETAMEKLFAGQIPYVDFPFEHLPLSAVPMALAYPIARVSGLPYTIAFAAVSLATLFATGEIIVRIADRIGVAGAGVRWVWIAGPIFPLVMFRVDALSVLLASVAVLLAIQHRELPSFASAAAGILAKGWPVVGAASDWWRGKRLRALALVGGTAAMGIALLAIPGFRSGREFAGIHQETIVGAFVVIGRAFAGSDLGLTDSAGAVYVAVGQWAVAATFAIGAIVGLLALLVLRRTFSWQGGISLTAALIFALLLGSPLLSAQFLLWPMSFVAIADSRRTAVALSVAGGMSMLLVGVWLPGSTWWHLFIVIRNIVLVVAAGFAMRDLQDVSARAQGALRI